MKISLKMTLGAVLWTAMFLQPSTLLAQGSLSPPGAPAPTMKTLAQIEPRTPIATAPFTISVPGSYYLTTNLTVTGGDAITIATNGVTLDLNGFTISSTANPASGTAVLIGSGLRNIAIQNGHIQGGVTNNAGVFSGPGFASGVVGPQPKNVRVSGVSVSGCQFSGIHMSSAASTTVENCVVRTVGQYGIVANTIRACVATDCGSHAVYGGQVSDSYGDSVGGYGIGAITALNCYGLTSSGSAGVYVFGNAQNCYGSSGSGAGLSATTAQNCYGVSSSGTGLYAVTALNCYGESISSLGLETSIAQNCYGLSSSSRGIYATYVAVNSYGRCLGSGGAANGLVTRIAIGSYGQSTVLPGLSAFIANSCDGIGSIGVNATHKYNMP